MNFPDQPDNWIGHSIGDGRQVPGKGHRQRYRLERLLGAGGMGDVYLAMDTLLGKQVALKLLKDTLVAAEDLRKRFEREVVLCAALKSDHIVDVSDYGVTLDGHPFYVMEYLCGQSLRQLLRCSKRLSVKRTVNIITQVCEGLHLAHEGVTLWRDGATVSENVKITHRDLKPDNIFLVPTALGELVKILDFGIAKIRDDTAEHTNLTSTFIGTYRYAAPEQLGVEKDLDGRADIYSLGIILYEMLTGTDPFGLGLNINNISAISWASAHTSKQPTPLRSQPGCEQMSPELEAAVMRCLQKAPLERFARVDELKQALQAAVVVVLRASETTIARPLAPTQASRDLTPSVSLPPTQANPLRKERWQKIAFMGLFSGLIAGSIFLYNQVFPSQPKPIEPIARDLATYENLPDGIKIKYPEIWEKQENRDPITQEVVKFISPKESGLDPFREQLIIEVKNLSSPMSLDEYTKLSKQEILAINKNAEIVNEGSTTLAGKQGYSIVYISNDDNKLEKMEVWTLKNYKAYSITYEAKADKYDKFLGTAETMIKSLQIE